MRGHEALIAMRKRRIRPSIVFVSACSDPSGQWRDWHELYPDQAHVEVADDETISGLDFRFAVGMLAVVDGHDPDRVARIARAIQEAGARRVVAAVVAHDGSSVTVTNSAPPKQEAAA